MEEKFEVRDHRNKSMFRVDDEIIDKYARKIGITALNVYLYLCRHADRNQESFPSQIYLAGKIGVSKRSIIRAINTLEKFNIINIRREWRKGTQKTNNTYILLDKNVWKNEAGDKSVTLEAGDISNNKQVTNGAEAGDTTDTLRIHIYKDTHNKDIAEQSSAEGVPNQVSEIIKQFADDIDPKNKLYYNNKTQRAAVQFLISEYSYENTLKMIASVKMLRDKIQYFPSISTPCEMRDKWGKAVDVINRLKNKKSDTLERMRMM